MVPIIKKDDKSLQREKEGEDTLKIFLFIFTGILLLAFT